MIAEKRKLNIIFTGVSEDVNEDDETKALNILQVVDCADVVPVNVTRIGKVNNENNNRIRPLLVVTASADERKKILSSK